MLRITSSESNGVAALKLEGRLVGPWVGQLRLTCDQARGAGAGLVLDLSDVTFVDAEGLCLLQELAAGGVGINNRSRFIAELLRSAES
ncbi:MAG TPA: hypothetical protein VGM03_01670 [Phycisphaerae bacterium]